MFPLNITQPLGIWSINVYTGYYKVMSNIPKMGHLTNPGGSLVEKTPWAMDEVSLKICRLFYIWLSNKKQSDFTWV